MFSPESLKKMRLERGWTQAEAAERAGIDKAYLSSIENGARKPSPRLLLRLKNTYEGYDYRELAKRELDISVEEMTSPEFIKALRALREQREWTLEEVAARAAVSYSHISQVERGTREPSPQLEKSLRQIYSGEGSRLSDFEDHMIVNIRKLPRRWQHMLSEYIDFMLERMESGKEMSWSEDK